jgi:plastocyanin
MSFRPLLVSLLALSASRLLAADPIAPVVDPAAAHSDAAHSASGLKREWIDGVKPSDFLKLGDGAKTVKVTLISAFNEVNHGMNFNGYSHGKALYTIPMGWKVEVTFINPSPVPHSAIIVERPLVRRLQMGEPAFEGGSVANPAVGMSLKKATFTFTASEPGDYAFACGFPTHAISGHWVAVEVSNTAQVPTLKLGDAEPFPAK